MDNKSSTAPGNSKASDNHNHHWVPGGKSVTVAGRIIDGGLFYLGTGLCSLSGYQIEPALIDPYLPVALPSPTSSATDYTYRFMMHLVSYSGASPETRSAYLDWLASGKRAPNANIEYVLLYFYGLERRALADLETVNISDPELTTITNEIGRLSSIYGCNDSFNLLCRSLLDYLYASRSLGAGIPQTTQHRGLTFKHRFGLAKYAADNIPLPVEWAWSWYEAEYDADKSLFPKTLELRCPEEFKKLFIESYLKAYGDGIKLTNNKTRLKINYQVASSSFAKKEYSLDTDLPDVSALSSPMKKLQKVAEACYDELDSYSRLLNSNDKAKTFDERTAISGYSIQTPATVDAEIGASVIQLNMDKVAALQADSERISSVLNSIFAESAPAQIVATDPTAIEVSGETAISNDLPGLDNLHSELVLQLCTRPHWTRFELEEMCTNRGLMVDGTLEQINEACYECHNQPLTEGNDPIELNMEVAQQILSTNNY
jgi:hypothetical protein